MSDFVGDERGIVAVEFTIPTLEAFIEAWNRAEPYDLSGEHVLTLSVEEYEPGKARLTVTSSAREVP